MMPLWLALPALAVAALVGVALERASGALRPLSDRTPLAWLVRVVLGMAVLVAFAVHPALGVALPLGLVAHVRHLRARGGLATPAPGAPLEATPWTALAVVLVLVLVVLGRPAVPLAWDEEVWLASARLACDGPFALAARALDPEGGLVPRGYPIGAPVLHAALALFGADLGSLTAGAAALVLVSAAALALTLASPAGAGVLRPVVALVLGCAPLVWAHVRTGMLDLPLGLLSASFALALVGAARRDARLALLSPALACVIAALKDEGVVYVGLVALGLSIALPEREAVRRHAAVAVLAAVLVALSWRLRLGLAGVEPEHHVLAGLAWDALPALLRELARAAADVGSFGAALALVLAATVSAVVRRGRALSRALGLAVLGAVLAALLALAVGPPAVREFALEGTVFSRLLLQLLPLGALVVGAAVAERDARRALQ